MFKIGDRVGRRSYDKDICFKIEAIDHVHGIATLKGCNMRLLADAPLSDLVPLSDQEFRDFKIQSLRKEHESARLTRQRRAMEQEKHMVRAGKWSGSGQDDFFERPGTVLHLDGDSNYLEKCLTYYEDFGLTAHGFHIQESRMPEVVTRYLEAYEPDILIITGHDGLLKKNRDFADVRNYRNTENFVKTVRAARKYERSYDNLMIFAGACQSHYEALLAAGANFASSPSRILIHALDPVLVAEKIAYTPINRTINIYDVVRGTITGTDGLGGIESRGMYRIGIPKANY